MRRGNYWPLVAFAAFMAVSPSRAGRFDDLQAPTLEEASESFESLLKNYVAEHQDFNGRLRVKDSRTKRTLALSYVRSKPETLYQTETGKFAGEVILKDASGKTIAAEAVADMRGNQWRIILVRLFATKKIPAIDDMKKPFSAAVLDYVHSALQSDKAFILRDDAAGRDRKLRLRMIPAEVIALHDESHLRSCVFFTDLNDKASVDVDFFVSLSGEGAQVYKTAIHAVDGKARFSYDRRNNMVFSGKDKAPH